MIHPTAIIHPEAHVPAGVEVGAYAVIGANVRIGQGSRISPHVVIQGPAVIGERNRFFQFCSIGADPQDKKYRGEPDSWLEIGSDNTVREYVSINRGTLGGGGKTVIGDHNWIMAGAHIAHDCRVGNHTVFANHATLAGHVRIDDYVTLGGLTGVHQFCRVGRYSFTAISSVIVKDVPPYIRVTNKGKGKSNNTARPTGLNLKGLQRAGFDPATIKLLRRAYESVYRKSLRQEEALAALEALAPESESVNLLRTFIADSERGIVR